MVVRNMEIDLEIGVFGIDVGTMVEESAQAVDDGVLGFEGGVVGMGEDVARGGGVDHKGAVDVDDLLPLDAANVVVEFLVVVGLELGERLEDGQSRAAGVVGAIEDTHIAGEGDSARKGFDVLCSAFAQLVGEDFLEAEHCFGYHLELFALLPFCGYCFTV